eukprot:1314304-Rhodomonas_salina.4
MAYHHRLHHSTSESLVPRYAMSVSGIRRVAVPSIASSNIRNARQCIASTLCQYRDWLSRMYGDAGQHTVQRATIQ